MYVITEGEDYEYEYPLALAETKEEAIEKARKFIKTRNVMIDFFGIYEILEDMPKNRGLTLFVNSQGKLINE